MANKQKRYVRVIAMVMAGIMLLSVVAAFIAVIVAQIKQEKLDAIRESEYAAYQESLMAQLTAETKETVVEESETVPVYTKETEKEPESAYEVASIE